MAAIGRKVYREVARTVSMELSRAESEAAREAITTLARAIARDFKADNIHFRFDVFYAGCGLDQHGKVHNL